MTTTTPAAIFAETGPVFLDFDGPVTHLFVDGRNQVIADRIRVTLAAHDVELDPSVATTEDPLLVLRWAYDNTDTRVFSAAEQTCIDGEIQAAGVSDPTPGSTLFIRACRASNRPLIILSNNTPEAIHAYLDRLRLTGQVDAVVGRPRGNPALMKPNRYLVDQALQLVGVDARKVAFVGDSITDIEVGELTGLRTIGFAKRVERGTALDNAGAEALTSAIENLAREVGVSA